MILLWLGCNAGVNDLDAAVSEDIPTVVTVSWTTDDASQGYVRYGTSEDMVLETRLTAEGTEHSIPLLGLPAESPVFYQVVVESGRKAGESSVQETETGAISKDLPEFVLPTTTQDEWMVVPFIGTSTGPLIIDGSGNVVWYHFEERELDVYRAVLSVDGESLLYNAASVSGDPAADSEIVRVSLDGSTVEGIPIPLLAHDFVEHPDGTIGAMVVEYRDYEGSELRGDSIVEVAPDGTQTTIWSAWDCWDPADTLENAELGWTFGNALDYDPDEEVYYLGMRNFSSIARIDRASGACDWTFGRTGADFGPDDGSASFLGQHQFQFTDEGTLLVFDNDGASGNRSRALEYDFDADAQSAAEIWEYMPEPDVYTFVLGDVHRLSDGDTLVTFSASGQIDRVAPDGTVEWSMNTGIGSVFAFNTVLDDLYVE